MIVSFLKKTKDNITSLLTIIFIVLLIRIPWSQVPNTFCDTYFYCSELVREIAKSKSSKKIVSLLNILLFNSNIYTKPLERVDIIRRTL